jgi:hypothetical protein
MGMLLVAPTRAYANIAYSIPQASTSRRQLFGRVLSRLLDAFHPDELLLAMKRAAPAGGEGSLPSPPPAYSSSTRSYS